MEQNLLNMFNALVNECSKNIEFIQEGSERAKICADLSLAIATLLSGTNVKLPTAKDSLTTAASKSSNNTIQNDTAQVQNNNITQSANNQNNNEQIVNTQEKVNQNVNTQGANISKEITWDEKKEQVTTLYKYIEAWGADNIYETCIPAFYDNSIKPEEVNQDTVWNFIRPQNIDAFLIFLNNFAQQN